MVAMFFFPSAATRLIIIEPGVSGGTPLQDRPQGGRLYQSAQRSDTVVAAKLDRMFRSAGDCIAVVEGLSLRAIVEAMKQAGVPLSHMGVQGALGELSGKRA